MNQMAYTMQAAHQEEWITQEIERICRTKSCMEPIAIVGMSCRFPAGSNTPEQYWNFLEKGGDSCSPIPADRWISDQYYDPSPQTPGKTHTQFAHFLTYPIDGFDAHFFNISGKEALAMDPQQRLVLELTWEAFEDAALDISKFNETRTGVYLGIASDDYAQAHRHSGSNEKIDGYSLTGTCFAPAAGRISYTFGFEGPCVSIDTACSSSLVALHFACQGLRNNEADLAIAGGVNLILSPVFHICSTKLGTISPDGRCKTFDISANGYGRGEGCGLILLKRFRDAVRDQDRILALIRATGVNQDGKSNGLTAPNGRAQEKLIRSTLQVAGLDPGDIDYIEAHGTGTQLGDPIEVEAIVRVMKDSHDRHNPIILGSVKSNIGHLEAAAGISGLIKVIQSLRHEKIPKNLHLTNPNPMIAWNEIPVRVPLETIPWPRNQKPRRAGVSSYGFSGTNAHTIVEEAPIITGNQEAKKCPERPFHLLPLSARTEEALKDLVKKYDIFLGKEELNLADVCYTAGIGRAHSHTRVAFLSQTGDDLQEGFHNFLQNIPSASYVSHAGSSSTPRIAFLFTGQGSQYTGMGRALYETHPLFKEIIDQCDVIARQYMNPSIVELIYGDHASDKELANTANTQPAIFAIQYALAHLWKSWGIEPDFIAGHSVGEAAAACFSGVMRLEDGIRFTALRGKLMQSLPSGGGMAAVFAGEDVVRSLLETPSDTISIAAINAPGTVVLSGDNDRLAEILEQFNAKGISSKKLIVSHAFHSELIEPILDPFEKIAAEIQYASPRYTMVSTLSGDFAKEGDFTTGRYWREQIRKPVQFYKTAKLLADQGVDIFIEIGAMPSLTQLVRGSISVAEQVFLPSLKKGENDWKLILSSLAACYVKGASINWKGFDEPYSRNTISLPTYPFQRKSYYMSPIVSTELTSLGSAGLKAIHPYIGQRFQSSFIPETVLLYQTIFTETHPAFLKEHLIYENIISPGAAHLCMAISAWRDAISPGACVMEHISLTAPLTLKNNQSRFVQLILENISSNRPSFKLTSKPVDQNNQAWITHCAGEFARYAESGWEEQNSASIEQIKSRCPDRSMTHDEFYSFIESCGYQVGSHFRCVKEIYRGNNESLCLIQPVGKVQDTAVHPGIIDSILQTVLPSLDNTAKALLEGEFVLIPLQFGQVYTGSLAEEMYSHTTVQILDRIVKAQIRVMDKTGKLLFEIKDFLLKQTDKKTLFRDMQEGDLDCLYTIQWQEKNHQEHQETKESPAQIQDQSYILISKDDAFSHGIKNEILRRGEKVIHILDSDRFEQTGDAEYKCALSARDEVSRLLEQISQNVGSGPVRILYTLGVHSGFYTKPNPDKLVLEQKHLCESLGYLIQGLQKLSRPDQYQIWVQTRLSQPVLPDDRYINPDSSPLWGFARTASQECPELWGGIIDVDDFISPEGYSFLVDWITHATGEKELAIRQNNRGFVPRFERVKKSEGTRSEKSIPQTSDQEAFYLDTGNRGTLDELVFKTRLRQKPQENEMEIRVYAAGLNFRDVLNVLGQYPGDAGLMGYEASGVITRVGENCIDYKVGDTVLLMDSPGCFCDYITCHSTFVVRIPESIGFHEAVTIPAAFLTAYYGLVNLAQLKKGERILIHAGAGGVGLAAIQIAKHIGVEIFATAGSEEKRQFLLSYGVHHVFNSRNLQFAEEIMQITQNQGVHAVLNSLAGEFIEKSFSVLSPEGRFLEIGKTGVWTEEQVRQYNPTLSYHCYDLAAVARSNSQLIGILYKEISQNLSAGHYQPLPFTVFPMDKAKEAFRFMAQARHIGKVVLSRQNDIVLEDCDKKGLIHPDASYLITGGLGSLGLLTAEWLAKEGAGHIVLTGRSGVKPEAEAALSKIRESGTLATIIQADIANKTMFII